MIKNIYGKIVYGIVGTVLVAFLSMCGSPSLPQNSKAVMETVEIYPDYYGVTIPCNIAPLNFELLDSVDASVAHIHAKGSSDGIVAKGPVFDIDQQRWKEVLKEAQGDTVIIDVFTKIESNWSRHPAIKIAVAEEIDPYISYRQIEPSYIGFEVMRICQRNLENFDEKEIFNNCVCSEDESGQCINCHSYQNYNKDGNMQMHVRINHGGTVIVHNGEAKKINLKTPSTISAGVYPSWHPTLPIIAYSNNITTQNFHCAHNNKVEVQDGESDIILYNIDDNKISIIANEKGELETFPYWNHDGTALYYVSAKIPVIENDTLLSKYKAEQYRDFKYNIYKKEFDAKSQTFGPTDTIFMASEVGASATFPRESPDGKYLLFTLAPYGTFHIWHKDADLYLMDLVTGKIRNLEEVNSDDVESYHSWSSNGKWIIFSSRREDGSYTRLYMAHFDENGKASKPFLLPQRDPEQNHRLYKSYNIPEFVVAPVSATRQQLMDAVKGEACDVTLKE